MTSGEEKQAVKQEDLQGSQLDWNPEALSRLERVPPFARSMARLGVEEYVRSRGKTKVTAALFQEAAQMFGMTGDDTMGKENDG